MLALLVACDSAPGESGDSASDILVITAPDTEAAAVLERSGLTTYTLVDGADPTAVTAILDAPDALAAYDLVVFEGGFVEDGVVYDLGDPTNPDVGARIENLRDYVAASGWVFATEAAYDVVEVGWPDQADFVGDDALPEAAQLGSVGAVTATARDDALATFLGATEVPIDYTVAAWPPVESVADDVTLLLTGTVSYADGSSEYTLSSVPLLYELPSDSGRVSFSTFRLAEDSSDALAETLRYLLAAR